MRIKLVGAGLMVLILTLILVGCSDTKTGPNANRNTDPTNGDAVAQANATLLDPLVMKQKPDKPLSVRDVLSAKEGETVIVSGRTPTEKIKPFNTAFAAFLLMAPEDLDREEVKEEFDCDEAATCPRCKKILDESAVRVELVDASGAIIPTTLEGYRGLKPGGPITVEGEIKRDGKDKKTVRIIAKRFYPG